MILGRPGKNFRFNKRLWRICGRSFRSLNPQVFRNVVRPSRFELLTFCFGDSPDSLTP